MFNIWKSCSWVFLFSFILLWFFITGSSPLFLWVILEVSVWATIFFFFLSDEEKLKNVFNFFIVQSFCSLFWLSLMMLNYEEYNFYLFSLCVLLIYYKMGLIPTHFWMVKIYEMNNLQLILINSILQKIFPLGMLLYSFCLFECEEVKKLMLFLILINILGVIYLIPLTSSLSVFFLLSTIVHVNNILVLFLLEKLNLAVYYFIIYSFSLVFGLTTYWYFQNSPFAPRGGGIKEQNRAWLLISLLLVGFPPNFLFIVKIVAFFSYGGILNSFFIWLYVPLLLIYMFCLIFSFFKGEHFSPSSQVLSITSMEEGSKNFLYPLNSSFFLTLLLFPFLILSSISSMKLKIFFLCKKG